MKLFLFVSTLLLASCANHSINYNPENVSDETLARITSLFKKDESNLLKFSWINSILNDNNENITNRSLFDTEYSEAYLAPGYYTVRLICVNGVKETYGASRFELKAGVNYQLYCDWEQLRYHQDPSMTHNFIGIREIN